MNLRTLRPIAAIVFCLGIGHTVSGIQSSPPLFFTPEDSAVPQVIEAIKSARTSIHMEMYHLTDATIIQELVSAHQRGVNVQMILDKAQVTGEKPGGAYQTLTAAGINVLKSSGGFSLTHEKAFVIDGQTAYIMTLNLTRITSTVRDVGYITNDPATVRFVEDLFTVDTQNAASQGNQQPSAIPDNIILSPGARPRIEALIKSAQQSLLLVVENLSDAAIINDLIEAQHAGVKVQVLLPRCDMTAKDFDMPAARQLAAGGVDVRMMPAPMTADQPYLHQKSIVVDGMKAFLGSENYSLNSLDNARELGVIVTELDKVRQMSDMFGADFAKSMNMQASEAFQCPARPFDDDDATEI